MKLVKRGETSCSCEGDSSPGWGRKMRGRLMASARRRLGIGAPWVQRHVAHCPRCRQRLLGMAKVDLALSVIKSQPHGLDLLTRANTAAIHMLSHQLRETEEADRLKEGDTEPLPIERRAGHQNAFINVAACLAILLLTKAGIFSSLDKARTRGEAAVKQYYTDRAGVDLAGDVFKS